MLLLFGIIYGILADGIAGRAPGRGILAPQEQNTKFLTGYRWDQVYTLMRR